MNSTSSYHNYALDIQSGKLSACKIVQGAIARYFADLKNPLYTFDEKQVDKVLAFSRLCYHVTGQKRGKPIELAPWQQFIIANLFGFIRVDNGLRKYRTAYIEVPRKSGKSTFVSIIVNWFLICEQGQQDIFTAAVSRDQARIVFDAARQMIVLNPTLKKRVKVFQHHIVEPKNNSTLKPLAAKAKTIEGTNPSLAIVDEYHLHPDNSVYSALSLGMGARPNAMLIAITTAGTDTISPCKQQNEYVQKLLEGDAEDDSYFGVIYTLDSEKEYEQESSWIKANPNLGVSVDVEELRAQVKRSKAINSTLTETLTKRFNIWCQGEQQWIKRDSWLKCAGIVDTMPQDDLIIGLDLSSSNDLTAIGMLFPRDNHFQFMGRYYIPESLLKLSENKNAHIYQKWVQDGHLIATSGDTIDYDYIKNDILELAQEYNLISVAYDPWNATYLTTQLIGEGITVEKAIPGFRTMSPASKELEVYTSLQRLTHDNNPVMNWAVSNVVMETDAAGNIKPTKAKSPNKIDPAIGLINAFHVYMLEVQEKNMYQERGIVSI